MNNENMQGQLYVVGTRGYSAYEVAVQNGFVGTEQEWLDSLVGPQGKLGPEGKSAYEISVENGYIGSEEDWVNDFLTPDGYYNKLEIDDKIVDNLSTSAVNKMLSANQGKVLKDICDELNDDVSDIKGQLLAKVESDYLEDNYYTKNSTDNIINTNMENINVRINSLASGSPLVADSTSDMTDTSRIYVNTSDGNWYYYDGSDWVVGGIYQSSGIANYSIEPFKTNFIEYSTSGNLYNFESEENLWGTTNSKGYFINKTTGEVTESTQYYGQSVTHYININGCGGKTLYSKELVGNRPWTKIAFYDGNKNFISAGTDYANSQLIPNNAVFVRIQYGNTLESKRVEYTCVSIDNILYVPFNEKYSLIKKINSNSLCNVIDNDVIENNSIDETKLSIVNKESSENLFDIDNEDNLIGTAVNDCYWSNNEGYIYNSTSGLDNIYSASYYIPIKPNQNYYFSTGNNSSSKPSFVNFYDKNKVFISKGVSSGSAPYYYTSPNNAKYLRFVIARIDNNVKLAETFSNYKEYNNNYYLNDNIKIKATNIENFSDINIANIDLLLPEKIYLIDREPLRLYKTSFVQEYRDFSKFRIALASQFNFYNTVKNPYNKFIDSMVEINSDDVDETLEVRLMDNYDITTFYGKNLIVEKKNVDSVSNSSPKISMFGDSTTYGGLVGATVTNLRSWGLNPQMIGTVNSGTGYKCEARAGYTYAEYIGYRTIQVDDTTETPLLPFLKVATDSDKTNHPDWCFTRTAGGSVHEKSYAEIVSEGGDTTQNFYIFDYSYYINNNNLQTPDIITFGLGINDAWKYGTTKMLEIGNLALTIMITQIHNFNQNINIGIIPFPVSSNIKEYHPKWMYDCLTLANNFNTTFGNERVNVIAESLSQCKELDFNYSEEEIDDSQICKYDVGDRTHTKIWGYREGSKPISYYIVNQL